MTKKTEDIGAMEKDPPDFSPSILRTRGVWTFLWIFLTILAVETLGFLLIRVNIAQSAGEVFIAIDLFTPFVLVFGALTLGYLYYSRYTRRILILGAETVTLKIGKKTYEYKWRDFSIVSLSIATSTVGVKGYLIRLYEVDIKGEYIDLPVYRFSKDFDVFDLRKQIATKLKTIQAESKSP